jgi:hypothetical protein
MPSAARGLIAKLKHQHYGSCAERMRRLLYQMELQLISFALRLN